MSVAIQGFGLERRWQSFFEGSVLFEDVYPGIEGQGRQGLEAGVDLFLSPEHRQVLRPGLIQIKASPAGALSFLQEGFDRRQIIPVVIGPPPTDVSPEQVLRRLALDYVWTPRYLEKSKFASYLEGCILSLIDLDVPLRSRRPKWTLGLQ